MDMLRIERVKDIEVLRQIALLQEREIEKLHDRLTTLSVELARLTGQDAAQAQIEIDILKDLLAQREHALFGESSEKRPGEEERPATPRKPRKGHGPTEQIDAADRGGDPRPPGGRADLPGVRRDPWRR